MEENKWKLMWQELERRTEGGFYSLVMEIKEKYFPKDDYSLITEGYESLNEENKGHLYRYLQFLQWVEKRRKEKK